MTGKIGSVRALDRLAVLARFARVAAAAVWATQMPRKHMSVFLVEAFVGAGTLGDAAHTDQSCLFNIIAFVTKGDFELNRTC